MTIRAALFPPANRTAALVAFLRTFWQTVRGVGGLTILGGGALVVNHAAVIDWPLVGWAVLGIILSGILAGALSGGDILANGLPAAYTDTVIDAGTLPGAITPKHSTDTPSALPVAPAAPMETPAPAVYIPPTIGP